MPKTIIHKIYHIGQKLQAKYFYLFRDRTRNIYHCCIQKSASMWFVNLFSDPVFWKYTRLVPYNPRENFIRKNAPLEKLRAIPRGAIVSPLYIGYGDFKKLHRSAKDRTFCIIRDPRDLVISNYFSLKYSHPPYDPYIVNMRKRLQELNEDEGITMCINELFGDSLKFFSEWFQSQDDESIKLFRFEDLFGENQKGVFQTLLKHCGISLPEPVLTSLLDKYSFKSITGRSVGTEEVTSHYRKGTAHDWQNYFSENHKAVFKKALGQILIESGYEQSFEW